jgi:hypothetical protein
VEVDFNLITVNHWDRLLSGVLLAKSRHLPWATLLRRTFEIDVTRCRKCHDRIRILCAITQRTTIKKILEHLGMPADPPKGKRGRDSTWNEVSSMWADM